MVCGYFNNNNNNNNTTGFHPIVLQQFGWKESKIFEQFVLLVPACSITGWISAHYYDRPFFVVVIICGLLFCCYYFCSCLFGFAAAAAAATSEAKTEAKTKPEPRLTVVPGARPFLGNPIPGGVRNSFATFEKWASEYGVANNNNGDNNNGDGMYECNVMGQKLVVLCSDETIATLEANRPHKVTRRSRASAAVKSLGADGILTAEGDQWKRDRRLVGPALNLKNVKDYVASAKLVASRLVTKWEEESCCVGNSKSCNSNSSSSSSASNSDSDNDNDSDSDNESLNESDNVVVVANADILCFAIDVVGLVVFATDIDSLRHGDKGICEDINNILKRTMIRIFAPFPYWNIPLVGQYLDGGGWYMRRARRTIRNMIDQTETDARNSNSNSNPNRLLKTSFLGRILALAKQERISLSEEHVVGNLFSMFAAGSETTNGTIVVCLYELALDKTEGGSLQDEIAKEVLALFDFDESENDMNKKNNKNKNNSNGSNSNNSNSNDHPNRDHAKDPPRGIQQQQQPVAAVVGVGACEDDSPAIDLDRLNEGLPRMRSLVYEVLRLKGPSPVLNGESKVDLVIGGKTLPANSQFLCLTRFASKEKKASPWSVANHRTVPKGPRDATPDVFCPRRWLVTESESGSGSTERGHKHKHESGRQLPAENPLQQRGVQEQEPAQKSAPVLRVTKPTHKTGFRAFGSSVRVCPGRSLAEMEILVLLSYILRKFELTLEGGTSHAPMKFSMRVAYQPDTDVRLVLKKRQQQQQQQQ